MLEAAVLDRQSHRAEHLFLAGEDADIGIANRQPVEDVVPRRHDVEQPVIAGPVEDHLPIAGRLDRDRLLSRSFQRQRHGAIEGRHHRVDVVQPLGLVESGMHQDRIARLRPPFPDDTPVAQPRAVVGLQEAREAGLLARALIVGRVNMQRTPFLGRLRLAACLHPHGVLGLAARPVRIGQLEPALIFRPRLQIQDAAGESIGNRVVEILASPVDVLAADSHQRQRLSPAGFADRPELHRDRRIPIRIPADFPLKAQVQERGVLHDKLSRQRTVLGISPHGGQEETQETWIHHGRHSTREISVLFPSAAQHTL